jgi:hypothetical protein
MRSSPLGKRLRDLARVPAIPDEKALEDERLPGARRTDHDLNAIAADPQSADHLGPVGADRGPDGKRLRHGARLHDAGANGALVEGAVDETLLEREQLVRRVTPTCERRRDAPIVKSYEVAAGEVALGRRSNQRQ